MNLRNGQKMKMIPCYLHERAKIDFQTQKSRHLPQKISWWKITKRLNGGGCVICGRLGYLTSNYREGVIARDAWSNVIRQRQAPYHYINNLQFPPPSITMSCLSRGITSCSYDGRSFT